MWLDIGEKFVKDHYKLGEKYQINNKNYKGYLENLNKIYKRSILLFPLLMDETTGGIVASAEANEQKTQCGRYAYCWTRDAVFICSASLTIYRNDKRSRKIL